MFLKLTYVDSTGYMLLLDGRSCTDVDECKENPRICTNGLLPGPYSTSCVGRFASLSLIVMIQNLRTNEYFRILLIKQPQKRTNPWPLLLDYKLTSPI